MQAQHFMKSAAHSRQAGGSPAYKLSRWMRGSLASAFALSLLVIGCGDESKPGGDSSTGATSQGSSTGLVNTAGNEQGPGAGATGTTAPGTTGAVPGTTTGTQSGTTTTTTGGVTSSSTGETTSSSTSVDTTSTSSTSDETSSSDPGGETSSDPGETSSEEGTTTEPEPEPKVLKRYTLGHGDVRVNYDKVKDDIFVTIGVDESVIDGVLVDEAVFSPDDVVIITSAKLTRPLDDDAGALSGLCVEKGESVSWLPQTKYDADREKTPFFGWASSISPRDLEGAVHYRLIGFDAPSTDGHLSMWQDLLPNFAVSSCDGLDGDEFVIETGHDHAHLGFSGTTGQWDVKFRVELRRTNRKDYKKDFTLHFITQ